MRKVRFMVTALGIVCVMCAAAVATANAASTITYNKGGKFTISSGAGTLETASGVQLVCPADTGSGLLAASPATTALLTVAFTGCKSAGKACTSEGAASGTIATSILEGTLGLVSATEKQGGMLLKPDTGTALLRPTKCGTVTFEIRGSVIGTLGKAGVKTKTLTVGFAQSGGVQKLKKFEGETTENNLEASFGGSAFERAGLTSEETLTLAEGEGELTLG